MISLTSHSKSSCKNYLGSFRDANYFKDTTMFLHLYNRPKDFEPSNSFFTHESPQISITTYSHETSPRTDTIVFNPISPLIFSSRHRNPSDLNNTRYEIMNKTTKSTTLGNLYIRKKQSTFFSTLDLFS